MNEKQDKPDAGSDKPGMIAEHMRNIAQPGSVAGITFALILVLFTLGGWWLDGKLGTSPLWVLLGFACGSVGGFIHLVEKVSPGTLFGSRASKTKGRSESGSGNE